MTFNCNEGSRCKTAAVKGLVSLLAAAATLLATRLLEAQHERNPRGF